MDTDEECDVEFRRYLKFIRPYLDQIQDPVVKVLSDEWIKKLSEYSEDKKLRNKYVFKLWYQLVRGNLKKPFTRPPMQGSLSNISDEENEISTNIVTDKKEDTEDSRSFIPKAYSFCVGDNNIAKTNKGYQHRVNNIIGRLRELKEQNERLRNELQALKYNKSSNSKNNLKVNEIKSVTDSSVNCELVESEVFNVLLNNSNDNQNNMSAYSSIDINHRLVDKVTENNDGEIEMIKTPSYDDITCNYITKIKDYYENKIDKLNEKYMNEKQLLIAKKDKLIAGKDSEIIQLKKALQNKKEELEKVREKLHENTDKDLLVDDIKLKTRSLERRLLKIEKSKNKKVKILEARLTLMENEKHFSNCSEQFGAIRQEANELLINPTMNLNTAFNKLESKYKQLVANVQAVAIKRRIQDEMTLQTIIKAYYHLHYKNRIKKVHKDKYKDCENHSVGVKSITDKKSCGQEFEVPTFCVHMKI